MRLLGKIRRLVDECHHKRINFLCSNYHVVLIPEFKVKPMTAKESKLSSKIVRNMMTWSHYRFRQRLLEKVAITPW